MLFLRKNRFSNQTKLNTNDKLMFLIRYLEPKIYQEQTNNLNIFPSLYDHPFKSYTSYKQEIVHYTDTDGSIDVQLNSIGDNFEGTLNCSVLKNGNLLCLTHLYLYDNFV